jgi:hypothetical protein
MYDFVLFAFGEVVALTWDELCLTARLSVLLPRFSNACSAIVTLLCNEQSKVVLKAVRAWCYIYTAQHVKRVMKKRKMELRRRGMYRQNSSSELL